MSHWYKQDGSTCYEIKGANGKLRETTLRDARKLNLVPSVTTILRSIASPALDKWKIEQVVKACLLNPKLENEAEEVYSSRVIKLSQEVSKRASERGTELHNELERIIKGELDINDSINQRYLIPVLAELDKLGDYVWEAERSFCSTLGYGGKIDLIGVPVDTAKPHIILDFKTKSKEVIKTSIYNEYCMQLVAYEAGIGTKYVNVDLYNLVFSANKPGNLILHKWDEETRNISWKKFMCLLNYWKFANNYDPIFEV